MGLLKKAANKMAYAKVGLYGSAGSGKTRTATEIAIGLHKAIGSEKPVAVFDTEPAFSFVLPYFDAAGIDVLISDESRALVDLMRFMDEAEEISDIAIVDSITHIWRDAQESYLARLNESRKRNGKKPLYALEFHHWRPIKANWAAFTDRFLSSKLHVIVCGRAGSIYEYQDKDDGSGKKELITTGTRMATEKELGYEPSLLIEMIPDRRDGKTVNIALVQKDRADKLNGREIQFPDYDKLSAHFAALNLGGQHFNSMDARDSQELYDGAEEGTWDNESRQRSIWCEEIKSLLVEYSLDGQSQDAKTKRNALLKDVFDTGSWTRVENMHSDIIKAGYIRMKTMLSETSNDAAA